MAPLERTQNFVEMIIERALAFPQSFPGHNTMDRRAYTDKAYADKVRKIQDGTALPNPRDALSDPYIFGLALGHEKTGGDFVRGVRTQLRTREDRAEVENYIRELRALLEQMRDIDSADLLKIVRAISRIEVGGRPGLQNKVQRNIAPAAILVSTVFVGSILDGILDIHPVATVSAGIAGVYLAAGDSILARKAAEMQRRTARASELLNLLVRS